MYIYTCICFLPSCLFFHVGHSRHSDANWMWTHHHSSISRGLRCGPCEKILTDWTFCTGTSLLALFWTGISPPTECFALE
jgi:hypothetical protein